MLLTFSVENFASIGPKQSLDLVTGKARGKTWHLLKAYRQSVLKFSSVYGANAAGKSTMIKAMHFGKRVVLNGCMDKRFMTTNRSSEVWRERPTEFTYTLFIDNKFYEYGFALSWKEEKIVKEWLVERNSRLEEKRVFIRDITTQEFQNNIKTKNIDVKNRISVYFADASKERNSLFLNSINSKKGDLFDVEPSLSYLKYIYRWFLAKLKFVYPLEVLSDLGKYSLLNYTHNEEKVYDCLRRLDVPISNMSREKVNIEQVFRDIPVEITEEIEEAFKEMYQEENDEAKESISVTVRLMDNYYIIEANADGFLGVETIYFVHGKYGRYEFKELSDGTKRILELLEMITSPEQDITYVVDEIERSLHPLLTEQLISMFLNPEIPNKNQLIIATHESRLLNLRKLRKDEIYFASNQDGYSKFVRLDEYEKEETRSDLNIELSYLSGRYSCVPILHKREES